MNGIFPKTGRGQRARVEMKCTHMQSGPRCYLTSSLFIHCISSEQASKIVFDSTKLLQQLAEQPFRSRPLLPTTTRGWVEPTELISFSVTIKMSKDNEVAGILFLMLCLMLTFYERMSCVLQTGLSHILFYWATHQRTRQFACKRLPHVACPLGYLIHRWLQTLRSPLFYKAFADCRKDCKQCRAKCPTEYVTCGVALCLNNIK